MCYTRFCNGEFLEFCFEYSEVLRTCFLSYMSRCPKKAGVGGGGVGQVWGGGGGYSQNTVRYLLAVLSRE